MGVTALVKRHSGTKDMSSGVGSASGFDTRTKDKARRPTKRSISDFFQSTASKKPCMEPYEKRLSGWPSEQNVSCDKKPSEERSLVTLRMQVEQLKASLKRTKNESSKFTGRSCILGLNLMPFKV